MLTLKFILLFLFSIVTKINADGHYLITAPGFIIPNTDYNVAVNVDKPSKIKISIIGKDFSDSKTLDAEPSDLKTVTFNLPRNLGEGDYNLTAEGISGFEFTSTAPLLFRKYEYIVLVQTDKTIYKPGDAVKFRAIFLDSNTKPLKLDGPFGIEIHDADKNLIKKYKVEQLKDGVHTDELLLSSQPVLGEWKITVDANGEKVEKTFKVNEYVLPRFEVKIETPKYITRDDGQIRATVRSKYTFGKPVEGELTVNLHPGSLYEFSSWGPWGGPRRPPPPPGTPPIQSKQITFNGKADIELDIPAAGDSESSYSAPSFHIEAILEEKFTGKKAKDTKSFAIQPKNYRINLVTAPPNFDPDEPVEVVVKLENLDGAPVHDTINPVEIYAMDRHRNEGSQPKSADNFFDENGMYTTTIRIHDEENSITSTIYAQYKNQSHYLVTITNRKKYHPETSSSVIPLEVTIQGIDHNVGKDITVDVKAAKELKYYIYQIVGRGKLLESKYVQVPNSKTHSFTFKPTFEMLPDVKIFVHFIDDGEFINAERTAYMNKELPNSIELSTTSEAGPKDDVSINIDTTKNSFVGLLSVDQSVLLLGDENKLRKSDIFDNLHESSIPYEYGSLLYPGKRSGLRLFTNARYESRIEPIILNAVPYGGSFGGPSGASPVRSKFPETWIWEDLKITESGNTTITRKAPDTITSWIITAFSLNPETGFGLTKNPAKLKVFQPFFASASLPYSVKRGETVTIPVVVFNYLDKPVDAEVMMMNTDDEFDFVEGADGDANNAARAKRVSIPSESSEAATFTIKPKKVGHITLKMTATSPLAGDGVEKLLLVEPEGVTQYKNKAVMIDLNEKSQQVDEVDIEIPEDAIPDSTHIEVSVVGDILGPVLYHLDDLVRKPYGCGEQNMVNLVPNIMILKYFEKTNQGTPEVISRAKRFTESGYQRELTYKHQDGSFSTFGEKTEGAVGSVWLTAYVARFFRKATDFASIDEDVIKKSLEFLAKNQQENGSFSDPGAYIFRRHNNIDEKQVPLTAFVTLAFLESRAQIPEHETVINKALDYIANNVDSSSDTFTIAISAYVLQEANHNSKGSFIELLETRATENGGKKWWSENSQDNTISTYSNINVESTSYALLALLKSGLSSETIPIVRWLVSQRNDNGGFGSTQDTVLGLQALMKIGEKTTGDNAVDVTIVYDDKEAKLTTNRENALVLQSQQLPPSNRHVKITSTGHGTALVQVAYKYNINAQKTTPKFAIEAKLDSSNSNILKLTACTKFSPSEGEADTTGMAVMEINLPSGYSVDRDSFAGIKSIDRVKRVESKKSDTVVVVYFESLDKTEVCPSLEAIKTFKVDNKKPASIKVYDYYDNSRQAVVFYSAPTTTA